MAVFEGRSLPRKSGEIGENRQKSAYQQAPNKGEQDGAERRPEKRPGPEIAASRDMARSEAGPLKSRALPLPGRFLPIFTDFYRFFGLSWETSTLKNYHPEDSRHSGSGRIEFSSKSTTFLM